MTDRQQLRALKTIMAIWAVVGVVAILTFAQAADRPDVIQGKIQRIVDGDTFVLNGVTIRLSGIDAPEMSTPAGKPARLYLVNITKGRDVICLNTHRYTYGRTVATCLVRINVPVPHWQDVSRMMVKAGHGTDWPLYSGGWYAR